MAVSGHVFASNWHVGCARGTPSQNHLIEKDEAFLGTVRTACRVLDIHVIAYTTRNFKNKFESQRTHFQVKSACEVTKISTEKTEILNSAFAQLSRYLCGLKWPKALPGSKYVDVPGLFKLGLLKSGKRGPEVTMKSLKYTE